jgi:small subunit ribosomal protein S13
MIYIFESKIPDEKSVSFALTYVYGINISTAIFICKKLGFAKNFKVKNLSQEQTSELLKLLEFSNIVIGSNLKKLKQVNLKKLISIKSYRGLRKTYGLPIRGQRTHTNARTSRKRLL